MIICYGSLGPDFLHRVTRLPEPGEDLTSSSTTIIYGGGAPNPAVALAAWGTPARVLGHPVTRDPLGQWLLEDLQARGVDVSLVERNHRGELPHCVVFVTPDGERTIVSSGYEDIAWQEVPDSAWEGVELVMVDRYSGKAGARVADEAGRRGRQVVGIDVEESAASCDWIIRSRREHPEEGVARELAAQGKTVILTEGPLPVAVFRGDDRVQVAPPPVQAQDPTGAGDVLAAACALGLLAGWEFEHSLRMAVAAASLLVEKGRSAGIPPLAEVEAAAHDVALSR